MMIDQITTAIIGILLLGFSVIIVIGCWPDFPPQRVLILVGGVLMGIGVLIGVFTQ